MSTFGGTVHVRKGGDKISDFGGGFDISNKFTLPYFIKTYQKKKYFP